MLIKKSKNKIYSLFKKAIPLIIFTFFFLLLNRHFFKLFKENTSFFLFIYLIFLLYVIWNIYKLKFLKTPLIIFQIILIVFQFSKTDLKYIYANTPVQADRQIKRATYYPTRLTKLGYYLELKKETLVFYKLEGNFFDAIDINLFFPNYFSYLTSLFVFIGLYLYFKKGNRLTDSMLLIYLLTSVIAGVNSKYGPVSIFPLIIFFAYLPVDYLILRNQ